MLNFTEIELILMISFGFSIAILFAKRALNELLPETFSFIYILGASITMLITYFTFNFNFSQINFHDFIIALTGGLFGALGYLCGYIGLRKIHAGITNTIFNLQGPFIILLGLFFYANAIDANVIYSLIISIIGLFMFSIKDIKYIKFNIWLLFITAAPIFWASMWIIFSFINTNTPIFYTLIMYFFADAYLFLISFLRKRINIRLNKHLYYSLCGGFISGLANSAYGIFILSYGTTLTGLITLLSVPITIILAMVFLKEFYTVYEMLGIVLISIGLSIGVFL
jgi:EamA-like transporter family.